jgi:endo-alpha-1,4-polygalactosaminidase (GH114 family)
MVKVYFVEVVNGGVDGIYLDNLHVFWLCQAQQKKVRGIIDKDAKDTKVFKNEFF